MGEEVLLFWVPFRSQIFDVFWRLFGICNYTPRKRSLGGYIGITLSVCLSVCLFVCSSVQRKFNLSNTFWTESDRAFILRTCITCGETFLSVPKFLIPWPWPPILTYFWKNLTLTITFELKGIGLSYYAPVFAVARPFCQYQNFWSCDLDLQLWPTFEKNLTLAITFEPKAIRLSYYASVFLVARPFCQYQNFWSCDLDLQLWPTFEKT